MRRHSSGNGDDAPLRHASESWHLTAFGATLLPMRRGGWTYIMTNRAYGVLYIGVTAHLAARVLQHRAGQGSEFCRRYRLDRLVLIERHERIEDAIVREKALKTWKRDWKLDLIDAANPQWQDLWDTLQG